MILAFALGGAYYAPARPLDARRLDVEIRLDLRTVRFGPFRAELTGTVRADGLTENAALSGMFRGDVPRVHYTLDFTGDDGRPTTLSFSQSLARVTLRTLTELTGSITERGTGTALGHVRLRFDARRALGFS